MLSDRHQGRSFPRSAKYHTMVHRPPYVGYWSTLAANHPSTSEKTKKRERTIIVNSLLSGCAVFFSSDPAVSSSIFVGAEREELIENRSRRTMFSVLGAEARRLKLPGPVAAAAHCKKLNKNLKFSEISWLAGRLVRSLVAIFC